MKKKEFAVGEVFQFGLKKLKVVELKERYYDACVLAEMCQDVSPLCIVDFIGECRFRDRADKKNVIFVEVEDEE